MNQGFDSTRRRSSLLLMRSVGKRDLTEGNMKTPMSISGNRFLAVFLAVALVYGSIAPSISIADIIDDRLEQRSCESAGGVWNGSTCEDPEPVDLCTNVESMQESEPCADIECEADGGAWDGTSCNMPPDRRRRGQHTGGRANGPLSQHRRHSGNRSGRIPRG